MRPRRWTTAALLCGTALTAQQPQQKQQPEPLALLPLPTTVRLPGLADGEFRIDSAVSVELGASRDDRLQRGVLRALKRLEDRTGVALPRSIPASPASGARRIVVTAAAEGAAVQNVDADESYNLSVDATTVTIEAPTTNGALHGLETMLQLVRASGDTYVLPALTITDAPRFPWRGLMIDCGRHFEPLDVLKRNIDAMAAVKLNVFHWHLTEDQGFRMESRVYPRLTALGSDGLFYTQDDARDLVRYARDRGIRVVPEFEMPGHSAAWLVAYPELASGTVPSGIRRQFGISDTALDPTREETYVFLEAFLREMTGIFPDQYLHIGGDETPAPDWKSNPRILAFKQAHGLADNDALQAYFNQRVLAILTKLNRRMVGWDEILTPALPRDVVVQSWRGEASLEKGAQQGYQGVLSAPYYLDAMKPAGQMYLADPVPAETKLTPPQQKMILGGEVTMWAEQLDEHTIDSRIWPRTAAIAERFWSAQNVRDVNDLYRRLQPVSLELEARGVRHLSAEDAGLRSLAESEDGAARPGVAQAGAPAAGGARSPQQHTSQLTPLTSFVDAVRPDPPLRHALALAVATLLNGPATLPSGQKMAAEELRLFFDNLTIALGTVRPQAAAHLRLRPMQAQFDLLGRLATLGSEALAHRANGVPVGEAWKVQARATLAEAKKPSQSVRFTFLDPLATLVDATR